ncbi:MAG: methyl-accepting chemotaxis protein [bacterium]
MPAGDREDKAKSLRASLRWAITLTNLVGMPILLIFIGAITGIDLRNLVPDFLRDPMYIVYNFALLGVISAGFVFVHYFIVIRIIVPAQEYIRNRDGQNSREQARNALLASEVLPYRSAAWSVLFYAIGTLFAMAALNGCYVFSLRQLFVLYIGVFATGTLISVFQFYTTRKVLTGFQKELLEEHPELLLEDEAESRKYSIFEVGLKTKFQGALVSLAMVSVILTAVAGFSSANQGFQLLIGKEYQNRIKEKLGDKREALTRTDPEKMQERLQKIKLDRTGGRKEDASRILLFNEEGESVLKEEIPPRYRELFHTLQEGHGWTLSWSRPSIRTLGAGVYTAVLREGAFFGSEYTVIHHPFQSSDLLVLVPGSRWSGPLLAMYRLVLGVIIVIFLVTLYFGKLASEEIRDPLSSLMHSLRAMAYGDLSRDITVTSRDEIGVVSRALARAIFGLRDLIGQVNRATRDLDSAAESIKNQSDAVSEGTKTQVESVDETSASMDQMKSSVQSIADSVQTLASSAEESSSSIVEVQATIEEVSNNVNTLTGSVLDTSSSIQQMNSSIKEVAENVQYLSRQSNEAMSALQEMEKFNQQVSQGSRETTSVSEKVSNDAEQGARSVSLTMEGIDKIQKTSQGVSEVITRLGSRAREIGNVLTVIEDVTEETNLLALNAAIIAAQAGEEGRGFAVVADEIKDLAERTAASTREIAELITSVQEDSQKAVERVRDGQESVTRGVELSKEAGEALSQIRESVNKALTQSRSMADAAADQTQRSEKVMNFMDSVNSLISQVAQATQEQTKTGDMITSSASNMEDITTQVKRATQEQLQGSRQVTQSIEHIAEIINYINQSQTDQLKSTEQARNEVQRIKQAAVNNQGRSEEMAGTVEKLRELSESLRKTLAQFTLQNHVFSGGGENGREKD